MLVPYSGDLPDPGIEPGSSGLESDSIPSEPPGFTFIYFIFDCVESAGATLHCGAWASHCRGLSLQSTGSRRVGFSTCSTRLSSCGALLHMASSQTGDRTCVPCVYRQVLIHQTAMEVLAFIFDVSVSVLRFVKFI